MRAVHVDAVPDPAHPASGPAVLLDPTATPASLRKHLLDQLIPALLTARPPIPTRRRAGAGVPGRPRRQHRPDRLRHTLTVIAGHLRDDDGRDWRWWELPYSYTSRTALGRGALQIGVGVLAGVVAGLLVGLTNSALLDGETGLWSGLLVGCACGYAAGVAYVYRCGKQPDYLNFRIRGRKRHLATAVAVGLGAGLAEGAGGEMAYGHDFGPGPGIQLGAISGAVFALLVAMSLVFGGGEKITTSATSATRSFRAARKAMIVRTVIAGGMPVLAILLCWEFYRYSAMFLENSGGLDWHATAVFLAVGTSFWALGSVAGTRGEPFAFVWAVLHWHVPWRLMGVLDDCHRLGLLRTIGPVYQFRHAQLQDYLAGPRPTAKGTSTSQPRWRL